MKRRFFALALGLCLIPIAARASAPPPLPTTCANVAQLAGIDTTGKVDDTALIQGTLNNNACVYIPQGKYLVTGLALPQGTVTVYGDGDQTQIISATDSDVLSTTGTTKNLYLRDFDITYTGSVNPTFGACFHATAGLSKSFFVNVTWTKCAWGARVDSPDGQTGGGSVNTVISSSIKGFFTGVYTRAAIDSEANTHYSGNTYGYVLDGSTGETRMNSVVLFGVLSLVIECTYPQQQCGQTSFRAHDLATNYSDPAPGAQWAYPGAGGIYAPAASSQFVLEASWVNGVYVGNASNQPSHVVISDSVIGSAGSKAGGPSAFGPAIEIANASNVLLDGNTIGASPGQASVQIDASVKRAVVSANVIGGNPSIGVNLFPAQGMSVQGNIIAGASASVQQPYSNTNTVLNNTIMRSAN